MQRILSTYLYKNQPLTPILLAEIARAGIPGVEIFCGTFHFNYGSSPSGRELADSLGGIRPPVCTASTHPRSATPW